MTEEELKLKHKKEKNRLIRLLKKADVDQEKIQMLIPIADNTAWMKVKLDDSIDKIKNSSVVMPFEQGKQKMIVESPFFKGYENLWKSYLAGMNQILAALPQDVAKKEKFEIEKPKTMLELVRERHKKDA